MGVVDATSNAEAQARIALQKEVEGHSLLMQKAGGRVSGAPSTPAPPEQLLQASEGATAGWGTFITNLADSQAVLTILAWRPQRSHPLPNSPGLSEQGQLIFVSQLID